MICDGYNLTVSVGSLSIMYRPLRRQRRSELGEYIRSLGSEAAALHCFFEVFIPQVVIASVTKLELKEYIKSHRELHVQFANMLIAPDWNEEEDEENLKSGLSLVGRYSHLNDITCEQCRYWWYDPIDGTVSKRNGEPLKRPEDMPLLCETQIGCPKGHWKKPASLSEKNKKAIAHYNECLATNSWPDDDIVRHNAMIISRHAKGIHAQ